ncbi:hypothetical protein KAU88_04170 [Candidatus Bathyarchaeota archaeon]|nr:hypothetical protein [Candidatus Bathyarchaeota archaeon]
MLKWKNTAKIMITVLILNLSIVGIAILPTMIVTADTVLVTDMPVVYIDPQNANVEPGENFTISVKIFNLNDTIYESNVEWVPGQPLPSPGSLHDYTLGNLYGLDIQLSWDPTILDYASHTVKVPNSTSNPDGILYEPILDVMDYVDSSAGTYWLAKSSQSPALAFNCQDANATVFTMTFNVTRHGKCTLDLTSVDLAADPAMLVAGTINKLAIPHWVRDGQFQNILATGIKSVKVEAHANDLFFGPPVISGENARVTVVMENYGNISDTYNLTLYKDTDLLETWNNETLESGENKTFSYTINAEDLNVGDHVIKAKATILHGNETFTDELSKPFTVIETPDLVIDGPTSATAGDSISFSASRSTYNYSNGQLSNYTWTLTGPDETAPRITNKEENVTFTLDSHWSGGNWTVALEVLDIYGIKYDETRAATSPYRKTVVLEVAEAPPPSFFNIENIALIVMLIVIIAIAIVYLRRRSR